MMFTKVIGRTGLVLAVLAATLAIGQASPALALFSTGTPIVSPMGDGRLALFSVGDDGHLWHNWQVQPNSGWAGFTDLGSPPGGLDTLQNPAVAVNLDNRMEVVVVGADGNVWGRWHTCPAGCSWSGWHNHGSPGSAGSPTLIRDYAGRLSIFILGPGGSVWMKAQQCPACGWGGWVNLGGSMAFPEIGISAVLNQAHGMELFITGSNHAVWHTWQPCPGCGWTGWSSLGSPGGDEFRSAPTVVANADGRLEIFAIGTNNKWLYHNWVQPGGASWSGWARLGELILTTWAPGAPVVGMNLSGQLEVFMNPRGLGSIQHKWQVCAGCGWSPNWPALPLGAGQDALIATSVARNLNGTLEVFGISPALGYVVHSYQTCPSCVWTGLGPL
jgi:hypothetical protein